SGIILLARSRLALKRPDLALIALDALPGALSDPITPQRLRTIALLWTNRIPEAAALDSPPDAWLDGLEAAVGEPPARPLVTEIRPRCGPTLSQEQHKRLDRLAARIGTGPGETTAPPDIRPAPTDR